MATSDKQQTKSHHYVPQFYLSKFSTKKNTGKGHFINVYDKVLKKCYPADIKDICCEDYFNDVKDRTSDSFYENPPCLNKLSSGKKVKEIKDSKDLENLYEDEEPIFCLSPESFFEKFETKMSRVLENIIRLEDLTQLSYHEKVVSAAYVVYQHRRTRAQREHVKEFIRLYTIEEIGKETTAERIEFLVRLNYNDSIAREIHLESTFDINKTLNYFLNAGWALYINETNLPYWTSDNQVIIKNTVNFDPYKDHHIQKGCKIYFPLTPKICLLIYDPSSDVYPTRILDTDIQKVIEKNKFQVVNSFRQFFSRDDISVANKLYNCF